MRISADWLWSKGTSRPNKDTNDYITVYHGETIANDDADRQPYIYAYAGTDENEHSTPYANRNSNPNSHA
jgi:hypothetical protein